MTRIPMTLLISGVVVAFLLGLWLRGNHYRQRARGFESQLRYERSERERCDAAVRRQNDVVRELQALGTATTERVKAATPAAAARRRVAMNEAVRVITTPPPVRCDSAAALYRRQAATQATQWENGQ